MPKSLTQLATKIHERILRQLDPDQKLNKVDLVTDQCSEMSRLLGLLLRHDFPDYTYHILKGENILNQENQAHDLLAIQTDQNIFIFDPTIFQFFPDAETIAIGECKNIAEAITLCQEKYHGHWTLSETFPNPDSETESELWEILKLNLAED